MTVSFSSLFARAITITILLNPESGFFQTGLAFLFACLFAAYVVFHPGILPDLTEERRRDLAKQIKALSEESKVAARNIRRDAMDALKKMKNGKEISEDECAGFEKEVEKTVSKTILPL